MDTLGTLYNVDELNLEVPPELHIHEYIWYTCESKDEKIVKLVQQNIEKSWQ